MFVHASVQSTHQSERGEKWLAGGGLCSGSELILASQVTKAAGYPDAGTGLAPGAWIGLSWCPSIRRSTSLRPPQ